MYQDALHKSDVTEQLKYIVSNNNTEKSQLERKSSGSIHRVQ